jgi:uncharacterized membrane protein
MAGAEIAFGVPAFAQAKPASPPPVVQTEQSVTEAMKAIRDEQHVSRNGQINPDKVSDDLLARLGAAVLNQRFPNARQRQWLENMMAGEGSSSRRSLDMVLGYNYLTGRYLGYGPGWLMGGSGWRDGYGRFGMRGPGLSGYGMMGWDRWYAPWIIPIGIGVILIVLVIVLIIVAAARRRSGAGSRLEILKTRLATGEITKEEYERLKDEVK